MSNERSAGRRFDHDHGVTTQALLFLGELGGSRRGEAYAHATHYEPVGVEAFKELLRRLDDETIRASTFVDLGAGMGRALLLASEYPFKQIFGIELSPPLYTVARENIENARDLDMRCRDLRVVLGDTRKRRYPKGDLVVFLFNPFDDEVLRVTLDRIVRSRAGGDRVVLVYHMPVYPDVVEEFAIDAITHIREGLIARLR